MSQLIVTLDNNSTPSILKKAISLLKGVVSVKVVKDVTPKRATSDWASKYAGCWQDSRDAEEIVNDIRSSRTFNREIEL